MKLIFDNPKRKVSSMDMNSLYFKDTEEFIVTKKFIRDGRGYEVPDHCLDIIGKNLKIKDTIIFLNLNDYDVINIGDSLKFDVFRHRQKEKLFFIGFGTEEIISLNEEVRIFKYRLAIYSFIFISFLIFIHSIIIFSNYVNLVF